MTRGIFLPESKRTPEAIAESWEQIIDRTGETVPASGQEQSIAILKLMQEAAAAVPRTPR
jgi:hypothetical protein